MSKYSDFINMMKPFEYERYSNVSSREKLVAFVIKYLKDNEIPALFNYVCVAAFKLFPDKFYFSEEFRDFPHIEMLNRTLLHLRPKENNYATGSAKIEYSLTPVGEEIAKQVESDLNSGKKLKVASRPLMDSHKNTIYADYEKLTNSDEYKDYLSSGRFQEQSVWSFFNVTPFTQTDQIKKFAKSARVAANEKRDVGAIKFINHVEETIS